MKSFRKLMVFALVWTILCGSVGMLNRISAGNIQAVAGLGTARPKVIIDPGHGGVDGGAVGVDGHAEKDINLAIAEKLRCLLELGGFEVIMTRESDISIHDSSVKGVRKQKTSDLHNRLTIVEANPDAVFVSIHQNKFSVGKYWGTQVFYGGENPGSMELASLIQRSVTADLQPDNTREIKKAGKNLYIVYNAQTPAVLVECGFMSNAEENARLQDPAYQDALAFSIYTALIEFYG